MPFRRRGPRPVVTSNKHEITWSFLAANLGASTNSVTLTDPVVAASKNTATEVSIGSRIEWIYIEFNVAAETITNPKIIHWEVIVVPVGMTISAPNVYFGPDRAYILKRGMEMLPKDVSTVYKRTFTVKIPRIYQRSKNNQQIAIRLIASSTETVNYCGFAIYKELN